jgi:chorismate mutase
VTSEHSAEGVPDDSAEGDPDDSAAGDPDDQLLDLRASIDNLDAAIVHLLAERFKCTREVGRLKARHHLPASDPQREASQIARLRHLAEGAGLDPAFAETFLTFIIDEVVLHHRTLQASSTE